MNVRIELVCVSADGSEQCRNVLAIERRELAMETLGISLAESKAMLKSVQDFVIAQQVSEDLGTDGRVPNADSGTRPKTLVARSSRVYSALWRYRIRGGTGAPAKPTVRRPSGRRGHGTMGEPVRRCFTWRPNGRRWSPSQKWRIY
jgi:hypothetical protein